MQDHVPVRDATMVQGHAVRQLYLCAGATDVFLETGERALLDALTRQWDDMTRGKMYLTGGKSSYVERGETKFVYSNDIWTMRRKTANDVD